LYIYVLTEMTRPNVMKYILSPLFIFSIYLLGYSLWLAQYSSYGEIIIIPFIFFGSIFGFASHHLIFGLRLNFKKVILLELLMILLLFFAGFLLMK
jgi:hypothetical protein